MLASRQALTVDAFEPHMYSLACCCVQFEKCNREKGYTFVVGAGGCIAEPVEQHASQPAARPPR